jgi:hypothetical protein
MQTTMPALDEILSWDNQLTAVHALPDYQLELTFADGTDYRLDFKPKLAKGGVMLPLRDPQKFSQVRLTEDGTAIEFPGEVDFHSDSLRWDAELQLRGLTRQDVSPDLSSVGEE